MFAAECVPDEDREHSEFKNIQRIQVHVYKKDNSRLLVNFRIRIGLQVFRQALHSIRKNPGIATKVRRQGLRLFRRPRHDQPR